MAIHHIKGNTITRTEQDNTEGMRYDVKYCIDAPYRRRIILPWSKKAFPTVSSCHETANHQTNAGLINASLC